ncbi:uncharacterized protein LOC127719477 [Mytilus californianus]|uniref:uncharacterized protein LOC127719477 n=1 Tax=Mytilus californianus TaxID=6549 RepID=UPI0022457AC0|nr:uncharacterized protein LOC127719477 [Mytilus californianus]
MGSLEGTFDTSLHEAVRFGDLDEVKVALQQGYDPNLIGLYQWSALHEAAHNGEVDILKCLLKNKGDPDRKDFLQGYTSLHYAAREDHVECLQLLLEGGGDYSISNNNGTSCLDIAKGQCLDLLQSLRAKDLMQLSLEDAKKITTVKKDIDDDLDLSISSSTDLSIITDEEKPPAIGYIHLTFEYNSKKSSLKIRVWQITDLLLPPTNTSMIHSLFIKSYLMPDKKKDSKRKTEEVRVDSSEAHVKTKSSHLSVQHVYSPSTFKFTKPLEYDCIAKDMIKERSVQIELCLTQKYSKRSFLIGMFHMKLKDAVKKMVREKYPLIPCMNHTIPANMKVYCASELKITNSKKVFYSNPDVRNLSDAMSDCSSRAASNPDMHEVNLEIESELSPVKLEMSEIQDYVSNEQKKQKEIEKQLLTKIPGLTDLNFDIAEDVQSGEGELLSRVVDITDYGDEREVKRKSAFTSVLKSKLSPKKKTEVQNIASSQQHSIELDERLSPRFVEDWKYQNIKDPEQHIPETKINIPNKHVKIKEPVKTKAKEEKDEGQSSRPETPTWDYYDLDLEPVEIAINDSSPTSDGAQPIYLPMDTTMGIKKQKSEMTKGQQKGHRKSAKRKDKPIPGKAVPQIIITDAENDRNENRKSYEFVTPRNVTIEMGVDKLSNQNKSNAQITVTADVHLPKTNLERSESTTIEIQDSDSFIIDLEDIDSITPSPKLDLSAKQSIPMQVFIDENYDSFDEASIEEIRHPYIVSKNNDLITEV